MDGVICDIDQYVLDLYQEKYPNLPYIPLSQRKSQSSEQEYRETFGDEAGDAMASFFKENIPNFFAKLPPFPKAVAAIKKLLENKEKKYKTWIFKKKIVIWCFFNIIAL